MAIFLRSGFPFNYDTNKASDESALKCKDKSLARDSEREESDINTIVKRFNLTGQLPVGVRAPTYMSFEGVFDYQSAMNAVRAAQEAFLSMPAEVRSRFHNDPQEFVDFCSDVKNRSEAEKLGLVDLPAEQPAKPAGAAPAATEAPPAPSPGGKPTP